MAEKRHQIRSLSGDLVEVGDYTRGKAIKAFCTECMGFLGHPVGECTSPRCPLYPYRGKIRLTCLQSSVSLDRCSSGKRGHHGE